MKKLTAKGLDENFDNGEDITGSLDVENATKRVNLDLPIWLLKAIDMERERKGQTRQALMRGILVDYIDSKKDLLRRA